MTKAAIGLLMLVGGCQGSIAVESGSQPANVDTGFTAGSDAAVVDSSISDGGLFDAAAEVDSSTPDVRADTGTEDVVVPPADPREGPGTFVAVGYSERRVRSRDGVTWTDDLNNGDSDTSKGNLLRDVVASDRGLLAVGTQKAFYSEDGITWIQSAPEGGFLGGVAYGNEMFVAAGGNGTTVRSMDGLTWESVVIVSPRTLHFRGIAFGSGLFMAVGDDGRRAVSDDGATWNHVVDGGAGFQFATYGEGKFVLGGHGARRATTVDGSEFANDVRGDEGSIRDLIHVRGNYYAIGGGFIFISETGAEDDWQVHPLSHSFVNIAFGNGRFVAVAGGARYVSDDAIEWEQTGSGGPRLWSVDFLPD